MEGAGHAGRCTQCLQKEIDITEGISRKVHLYRCGTCFRWLKPTGGQSQYIFADLESRELLAICLKSVKGISKERSLVNASFIWTEPHSKELKVKLTLQKEAFPGIVVQQNVVVEFRIGNQQCRDCMKSFTRHTWESNVQVRQRADHRRTLLALEQLILKHKAHTQLIKVQQTKEGMDFFFTKEQDAQRFVSFVKGVCVVRHHESKHLVSQNLNNNTQRFKRTTCVDVCPICRDDLTFLPPRLARAGMPPYLICTRAAAALSLVDPWTGRKVEVPALEYFKKPFNVAMSQPHLTEFVVLDINELELDLLGGGKSVPIFEAEVARVADFGKNDERSVIRTHLGFLQVGDHAVGYDLRTINLQNGDVEWEKVPQEVYLVRKHVPEKGKNKKNKKAAEAAKQRKDRKKAAAGTGDDDDDAAAEALPEGVAQDEEQATAANANDNEEKQAQPNLDQEEDEDDDDGSDSDMEAAANALLDTLGRDDLPEEEVKDAGGEEGEEDGEEGEEGEGDGEGEAEGDGAEGEEEDQLETEQTQDGQANSEEPPSSSVAEQPSKTAMKAAEREARRKKKESDGYPDAENDKTDDFDDFDDSKEKGRVDGVEEGGDFPPVSLLDH
eukprot:CAMPEP_0206455624 /NCGR_PEP_ID=MMETSP0324_2-20121206/21870_1 /ASSEMBLY_ACC=CAM_ASM_000836 /TAXON_ID=2866 /ORGANISM="Crypthecodinium cohnii, Strain Seligo" /LENGTH=611 /DNA_ID=CAMNT_0053926377 /DNA_START=94 /DNA_END=1930 /DNA_ORIENTATION=-